MSDVLLPSAGILPPMPIASALPIAGYVQVHHPGYEPPLLLLMLPAYRAPSGFSGVPLSLVLDACRIVANNQDGTIRVMGTPTDLTAPDVDIPLLEPGDYEYQVPGGEARYPIYTSFRAWRVPDVLPAHWDVPAMGANEADWANDSHFSAVVKITDGHCLVTGATSRLQCCHMVPEAEEQWWDANQMNVTTSNFDGINSPSNCLTMRADLCELGIDSAEFVFVPLGGTAVCICIRSGFGDFAMDYHLRAVDIPPRMHPMNMYARLAFNIFRVVQPFLRNIQRFKPDVVVIRDENAPSSVTSSKRKRNGSETSDSEDTTVSKPPRLNLCRWTEDDLKAAEEFDAILSSRPLMGYEEASGMYPGYSKAMRLAQKYREEHPEVSAVVEARIARVGEDEDEQQL